eukprot:GHVU01140294.1.p2 GENE.GHVU01140294.1~~GHVU01140294.1.p2  ORF type:complete len:196 (-),score=26.23 GHVU01140294.1:209-796(-)
MDNRGTHYWDARRLHCGEAEREEGTGGSNLATPVIHEEDLLLDEFHRHGAVVAGVQTAVAIVALQPHTPPRHTHAPVLDNRPRPRLDSSGHPIPLHVLHSLDDLAVPVPQVCTHDDVPPANAAATNCQREGAAEEVVAVVDVGEHRRPARRNPSDNECLKEVRSSTAEQERRSEGKQGGAQPPPPVPDPAEVVSV